MTTASQETRIEIWRYTFARASLVEAREAARGLIANPRLPDDLKRAIVYQIVVAYARPFTKSQVTESKRIVPLGNDIIHSEFRNLHKEYIQMRDCVFGHKDAVALPAAAINRVIVCVDEAGFELHTASPFTMLESGLHETVKLCNSLIDYCMSKIQPYRSLFVGVERGIYVLNLEANPTNWLVKKRSAED